MPVSRSYSLYSDVQRADDIIVTILAKVGEKHFKPELRVKLINTKITADGENVKGCDFHKLYLNG